MVEEITLHVAPVLLGRGVGPFDGLAITLEQLDVVPSAGVTHLKYQVKQ